MRNWTRLSGVYCNMLRVTLILVCSWSALAQLSQWQNPMNTALQAVWQARNEGRFAEAAAAREQARALLQRVAADSPGFAGWAQQVAQLYASSSLNGQARVILQDALARTAPLGETPPSHIAMLSALGESWRQDGNLLKAVGYLEQAAAAQAAAPLPAPGQKDQRSMVIMGVISGSFRSYGGYGGGAIYTYSRLADLYRQLGRPDAVAAVAIKIRALSASDPMALAQFYMQQGQFEEAAAIYTKLAEQSPDPQAKSNAWQSLADLDARQERFADAVDAMQQAIAAAQSSDKPGIREQAVWMRQNLAGYMRQAGRIEQADQVYQQLVQENRDPLQQSQLLNAYAQHLAETKRGAQGESLLKDYLDSGGATEPEQKVNVFFGLANLARRTGDSKSAESYQQAAQALIPPPPPPPATQIHIADDLQEMQTAMNKRRWENAYHLALAAIDMAPQAADGQQVQWLIPQIAQTLAANKEPAKAEQLFQRLFSLAQGWRVESIQPMIGVSQSYARFLMSQPGRASEAPNAFERYRSVLADANGPDSATATEPLRLRLEFERGQSQWQKAEGSARDLLELQESLSGNTSEPYLNDLQSAALVYRSAGDSAGALPLLRKAVTIADLVSSSNNDWRRSQIRMDTALVLASLGQFDEAETLGEQAVALQAPARNANLAQQLEQIRQMKRNAANASASRLAR